MKRVILISFLALIFNAVWQALSIHFPLWLNCFFIPPIILVFSLQFFRPLETIFVSLTCGFIADALGGFAIGSNMLLMLLSSFVLGAINLFSGRIYRQDLIYYVMAVSFIYRILLLICQLVFRGAYANVFIMQLLIGPMVDGLISVLFYYVLVKTLSFTKTFDQSDFFKNRIGLHQS